jgi:hypothetical protein
MKPNKLNKNQQVILKEFITRFLPQRGNKRKNLGNEIEYVQTALDKVFKK